MYDSNNLWPSAYQDFFALDDRDTKTSQSLISLQTKDKPEKEPSKGFDDCREAELLRRETIAPALDRTTFNEMPLSQETTALLLIK